MIFDRSAMWLIIDNFTFSMKMDPDNRSIASPLPVRAYNISAWLEHIENYEYEDYGGDNIDIIDDLSHDDNFSVSSTTCCRAVVAGVCFATFSWMLLRQMVAPRA